LKKSKKGGKGAWNCSTPPPGVGESKSRVLC
jgi:hypothetical protein